MLEQKHKVKDAITAGTYFGFTGPINKQDGTPWLADGEVATRKQLDSMMFYVEGIDSRFPG